MVLQLLIFLGMISFDTNSEKNASFEELTTIEQINNNKADPIGMGMASPTLTAGEVLYFYGPPEDGDQMADMKQPYDSLSFVKAEHYVDVFAPPYFVPEHMKLDYGFLIMKVMTVTRYFLEVEVNSINHQTAWVDRNAVGYQPWEDFLISVFSIEILDPEHNPLRIKPLDHASIVATTDLRFPLNVIAVKGEWAKVSTNGLADRIQPYAWVRWRNGDKLLISYSMLS